MESKEAIVAVAELGEVVFDNEFFKDSDVLGDLPIVGSLVTLLNFRNHFKTKSFQRKLINFINEFNEHEFEHFKKIVEKKKDDELGLEIINTLDMVEKSKQARMIARAIKLYIASLDRGEDGKAVFDHYMHVIKNLDDYLLAGLDSIYGKNSEEIISATEQSLYNLGLMNPLEMQTLSGDEIGPIMSFKPSETGSEFYQKIVLGDLG